ncbi:MAG: tRNA 5-methoxyuridine(34)/uridine 5-oxyacetic acid(34) synthase CmoB [Thiohalophilus sp.]|uniref:tRNA 5-methoxyuridine(34)/uridine 5-oxyacetic acid(34) synthase CmoB n=1 Tax=Thiohalophilus sp. TaxID=3028392 RepID=UPI002870206E|nr:tRNA 5-methoxyuridine(34)/uridine 5-oxyacetic acid(34) synthase CmoB [Thiohalophilus sp.]MDR9435566.1 tRNA 5-methoxyuridine(34)/uridine 5-oxyacetic acid(34) synthase CmoB [Thiohalophilus sp.]
MTDYSCLYQRMANTLLADWAQQLPGQIEKRLDPKRYGDLPKWQAAVEDMPVVQPVSYDLNRAAVRIGDGSELDEPQREALKQQLQQLHPWRKGPFELFGIDIDTEWRSDWKWERLNAHIAPLDGRTVLDVGCGNGYHCWRMRGAGAELVIGVDPTPLFTLQYEVMHRYAGEQGVYVLPLGIDDLPAELAAFDTVFSMGVLYHRRSPLDHLLQLRDCLAPGGELVLETLIVDGDENTALFPEDRYARMGNVWFLPSVPMLERWLRRCRFSNIRTVDVTTTSTDEQRATEWMTFQSLADFLDPDDHSKSIEGYPAPRRAIIIAEKA